MRVFLIREISQKYPTHIRHRITGKLICTWKPYRANYYQTTSTDPGPGPRLTSRGMVVGLDVELDAGSAEDSVTIGRSRSLLRKLPFSTTPEKEKAIGSSRRRPNVKFMALMRSSPRPKRIHVFRLIHRVHGFTSAHFHVKRIQFHEIKKTRAIN